MEAMTVMGMAASQARFLGLTARKSNVEYQVQQINQQRTSLANESAGLYNQMMELEVPVPPSVNAFAKTVYVLDNTNGLATDNYTIANMSKTYANNGEYLVTLETKAGKKQARDYKFNFRSIETKTENNTHVTTITMNPVDSVKTFELKFIQGLDANGNPNGEVETGFDEEGKRKNIEKNRIYALPADQNLCESIDGYTECANTEGGAAIGYYYQDNNGVNHFLTAQDLFGTEDTTKEPAEDGTISYVGGLLNNDTTTNDDDIFAFLSTYEVKKAETTQVRAQFEESDNGRLTAIKIADDGTYPEELRNMTFSLSATTVTDEAAYTQAYNDYEYEKALYEKAMSDINAATEKIQSKDQSLELKIQQLDTEQNAIQTEMDSVSKVIEDNIDKTFNIFG